MGPTKADAKSITIMALVLAVVAIGALAVMHQQHGEAIIACRMVATFAGLLGTVLGLVSTYLWARQKRWALSVAAFVIGFAALFSTIAEM